MSTRAQVDAMIPVFLAALREAGYPVTDDYVRAQEYAKDEWRIAWWAEDIPDDVAYRAITLARASAGKTMACWWCWSHHLPHLGPNPCSSGDCRAPSEATR